MLLDLLSYPFMQRALLSGVILGALLASLGVIATLRKMAFFGEGVAHASLAGIALALLAGFTPTWIALAWAIFIAILIYWLERSTKLPSDTVIGILFTASMALGVVIISIVPGFQPDLISFLFGSILSITTQDVLTIIVCSTIILFWFFVSLPQLTALSLNEDAAAVGGIKTKKQTLLFYLALAIGTVLGAKILGIILVSALLVLPPATSRLLARSFKQYVWLSIIFAELFVLLGLVLSFFLDIPSGASIVLTGAVLFFFTLIARLK